MKHKMSVLVKCPYYRGEEKNDIFCESLIGDNKLRLRFETKADFKKHEHDFCMGDYSRCELVQALDQKWDYQGRKDECHIPIRTRSREIQ